MSEKSLDIQRALAQNESEQKDPPHFGIRKEGALSYIIDAQGNKVSEGYHSFEVFHAQDNEATIIALVGKGGASKYLLKAPTVPGGRFEKASDAFHDLDYRPDLDGLFLTNTGAFWYIVDPITGLRSTEGYHSFFKENGIIYGKQGAHVEEIKITKKLPAKTEFIIEE